MEDILKQERGASQIKKNLQRTQFCNHFPNVPTKHATLKIDLDTYLETWLETWQMSGRKGTQRKVGTGWLITWDKEDR